MPPKSKKRVRRSSEQIQELLGKVESMCKAGEPLMKALEKVGISYSNYNYWVKKRGGASVGRGRGRRAGAVSGSIMGIIDEIRKNREERQKLEQQLRSLDSRFNQLRARLVKS